MSKKKYANLDMQKLRIDNALVNSFPNKIEADNYTSANYNTEQKGLQIICTDDLSIFIWDGEKLIPFITFENDW